MFEFIIFILINILRSRIPWIITNKDEYPKYSIDKINNFFKKTFDYHLGWNWKPYSNHKEKFSTRFNLIFFGKFGERKGKLIKKKNIFASFGDSFVFCRFVKNNQTWQEHLNKLSHFKGLNLGVGNYGLDQIYLKYLKTNIPKNIKIIFIGFVPEALSRCLCSWKHYHEFNNIYGFKPKFVNYKNSIKLINNPIYNQDSFKNFNKILIKLKKNEFFYKEKFLKYKFNFPYSISFIKNINRNFKLLYFSILKILNLNSNKLYEFIIKENCFKNDYYFSKKKNQKLIHGIMSKISNVSKKRKHEIFFLIFPQKYDLLIKNRNYEKFFKNVKNKFNVIDFTQIFQKIDADKIYLPGKYGSHLTAYGNKIVAKTILNKLKFKK